MPNHRRFEGRDLERLLAEIRDDAGPGATIVEANRIRTGGLWGFFAKEGYEVLVEEVPGAASAPEPPDATTDRPATLAELADLVSDTERQAAPSGRLSTEGPAFQAVLARVVDEASGTRPRIADVIRQAPPLDDDPPFEPWLTAGDERAVREDDEWTPPRRGLDAYRAARGAVVAAAVAATAATTRVPASLPVLAALGLPPELLDATGGTDTLTGLARALDALPHVAPLPKGPGSVIAVVGERTDALALAESLASSLDVDAGEVLLASSSYRGSRVPPERRVDSVATAAERRLGWRRRPGPSIVAIDCPVGRSTTWAAHVLAALEPTMTWGTVSATRKPEDIGAWSTRLGGIDALAATELDATESPAAVLQTRIPVGRLDGHPASAARWAAVLTDRLALS